MTDTYSPDTPRARGLDEAPHASPVSPAEDARSIALNRVSWGAILAGVVVALVTHLILNMIGIGIGAAVITPGGGDNPEASTFSIGAAIWFAVTGIVAALLGGLTAGRLAGQPKESTASWHGLTTWALTTLVIFWLLTTSIGALIGGTFSTLTNAIGGVTSAAGTAAGAATTAAAEDAGGAGPFAAIQEAIQGATGGAGGEAAAAAVQALVTGDPAQADQARESAAQAVSEAQGIPLPEARAQVAQYEQQYAQQMDAAGDQVVEAADTATDVVSAAALAGAVILLLGAVAGWFGGRMGTVDPTVTMAMGRNLMGGGRRTAAAAATPARPETTARRDSRP